MPPTFRNFNPADAIDQGDIFSRVRVAEINDAGLVTERIIDALVLSHGCEVDKPESSHLFVIALNKAAQIGHPHRTALAEKRVMNAYLIGEIPTLHANGVVADFRRVFRASKSALQAKLPAGRIAAVDEATCKELLIYFVRFMLRTLPQAEDIEPAQADEAPPAGPPVAAPAPQAPPV